MELTLTVKKQVEVKTLHVRAKVRYWEDATINGVEDKDGKLMPCRQNEMWCPIIDLETGRITNWETGTLASIHYKVCDAGSYYLKDSEGNTVASIEEDYVPSLLCPEENGYGDYIIMEVNNLGEIRGWEADLSDFEEG